MIGKCSACGAEKPESELNGVEILKKGPERYEHAYCRRLTECNSDEARDIFNEFANELFGEKATENLFGSKS